MNQQQSSSLDSVRLSNLNRSQSIRIWTKNNTSPPTNAQSIAASGRIKSITNNNESYGSGSITISSKISNSLSSVGIISQSKSISNPLFNVTAPSKTNLPAAVQASSPPATTVAQSSPLRSMAVFRSASASTSTAIVSHVVTTSNLDVDSLVKTVEEEVEPFEIGSSLNVLSETDEHIIINGPNKSETVLDKIKQLRHGIDSSAKRSEKVFSEEIISGNVENEGKFNAVAASEGVIAQVPEEASEIALNAATVSESIIIQIQGKVASEIVLNITAPSESEEEPREASEILSNVEGTGEPQIVQKENNTTMESFPEKYLLNPESLDAMETQHNDQTLQQEPSMDQNEIEEKLDKKELIEINTEELNKKQADLDHKLISVKNDLTIVDLAPFKAEETSSEISLPSKSLLYHSTNGTNQSSSKTSKELANSSNFASGMRLPQYEAGQQINRRKQSNTSFRRAIANSFKDSNQTVQATPSTIRHTIGQEHEAFDIFPIQTFQEVILEAQKNQKNMDQALHDHFMEQWKMFIKNDDLLSGIFVRQQLYHYTIFSLISLCIFLTSLGTDNYPFFLLLTCIVGNYLFFRVSQICYRQNSTGMMILPMYLSIIPCIINLTAAGSLWGLVCIPWIIFQEFVHSQVAIKYIFHHLLGFLTLSWLCIASQVEFQKFGLNCSDLSNASNAGYNVRFQLCLSKNTNFLILIEWVLAIISCIFIILQLISLVIRFRRKLFGLTFKMENFKFLREENAHLVDELKSAIEKYENDKKMEESNIKNIDLNSPLHKAVRDLQWVRKEAREYSLKTELTHIIKILTNQELLNVDLEDKQVDSQVRGWLTTMLTPSDKANLTYSHSGNSSKGDSQSFNQQHPISLKIEDNKSYEQQNLKALSSSIDFDAIQFTIDAKGGPLVLLGQYLFEKHDLCMPLGISMAKLQDFLFRVEHSYQTDVPYHNAAHATDVIQYMNYLMEEEQILKKLTKEEQVSMFIAAACHDAFHPGFNNSFFVQSNHNLALRYNDVAVLENFHCAATFSMLMNEDRDLLSNLSKDQFRRIRENICGMILATDMSSHFNYIGKMKTKVSSESGIDWSNMTDRKLVFQLMMKCADISNATRAWSVSKKWTIQITEEFFRQGDAENSLGLTISPFMNREGADIGKSQISFIDYVVSPLFEVVTSIFPTKIKPAKDNLQKNKQKWTDPENGGIKPPLTLFLTKDDFQKVIRRKTASFSSHQSAVPKRPIDTGLLVIQETQ